MGAHQAPLRCAPRRYALSFALTIAGCGLVLLAQWFPPTRVPAQDAAVPAVRRSTAVVSARGGRDSGRVRMAEERPATAGTAVPLLAVGGKADGVEPPAALSEEATPTPTPTPTAAPTPVPVEVKTYLVQAGDNLGLIAERFSLSQDTIVWANPEVERNPDLLKIGQELSILPVDGVRHTVVRGETLALIAKRYNVDVKEIVNFPANPIDDPADIPVGLELIIPGGVKPPEPRAASGSGTAAIAPGGTHLMIPAGAPEVPVEAPAMPGRFLWPADGIITQGYGKWHGAIDIANRQGTPLLAADAGTVTFSAWSGGLGNAIQIDHGDGFATSYGHLYAINVQVGQTVQRGDQIGLMGTTGHSTGPHLHLIVTYNGGIVNPMDYLPPR